MSDVMAAVTSATAAGDLRTTQSPSSRIVSVDFMRGLVMVIMAIDHSRDFLTNIPFEPEDITHTFPALFFTRWITHFCAPMFFFLAGTGAYLLRSKTGSVGAASRFLWTRGLWLVLLEFTIIEYAGPSPSGRWVASSGPSAAAWSCSRCSFVCRTKCCWPSASPSSCFTTSSTA